MTCPFDYFAADAADFTETFTIALVQHSELVVRTVAAHRLAEAARSDPHLRALVVDRDAEAASLRDEHVIASVTDVSAQRVRFLGARVEHSRIGKMHGVAVVPDAAAGHRKEPARLAVGPNDVGFAEAAFVLANCVALRRERVDLRGIRNAGHSEAALPSLRIVRLHRLAGPARQEKRRGSRRARDTGRLLRPPAIALPRAPTEAGQQIVVVIPESRHARAALTQHSLLGIVVLHPDEFGGSENDRAELDAPLPVVVG